MNSGPSPAPARRSVGALAVLLAAAATVTAAAAPATPVARPARPAAADTVDLLVAATTDVHGRLRGWDYFAGRPDAVRSLARAATVVDSLRRAAPGRVVLVDAGDLLQGTPLTYVAAKVAPGERPHPVPAAMNAMGYDAAAVGNHEFNYGLDTFLRAAGEARFPFLAANAYRPDGNRAFRGWTLVTRETPAGPVKVGIVGGTTPGSMVWDRDHLKGRLAIRDLVAGFRTAADEARAAGAEVLVGVVHSGFDEPTSYDTVSTGLTSENVAGRLAREIPGLDVLVFGHSHRERNEAVGNAWVLQPRNWAAQVGVAHLGLVRDGGRWRVVSRRGDLVPVAGRVESPAVLAATEAAHGRAVAYAGSVIGTTPVAWRADSARVADVAITDLVAEVMRRAGKADLAATAAFSLDAGLDSGAITVAELARLYPYENTLRTVRVTGAQLRAFLEHAARYYRGPGEVDPQVPGYNFDAVQGAEYVLDLSRPVGQRVTQLAVKGRAVRDADTFTLALNNYRQTGGGGFAMLADAPVVRDEGEEIRELVIEEVRRRGTLRPADYHVVNWRLEPADAVTRAFAAARRDAPRGEDTGRAAGARRDTTPAPRAATGGESATVVTPSSAPPFAEPAVRVTKDGAPRARGARPRRLRILAVNDFHGALEARPDAQNRPRGGALALAAAVQQARAECAPPTCTTVMLDGGDEFQGTPASNLAYGRPVVDVYRALRVDAGALGNHEFDWGVDTLRARIRQAPYRILAANVTTASGARVPWTRPDTLIVRDGLRIGVVGLATPETPNTTRAINVKGLRFTDMAQAFDARARALRARGADLVLVAAHSGAFCDRPQPGQPAGCRGEIVDFVNAATERVDAVVSGHTHSLVNTIVRGVPIVQARSSARALGLIDLVLDPATGRPIADSTRITVREVGAPPDGAAIAAGAPTVPAVDTVVRRAVARVAPVVERPVAEIAEPMRRTGEQYALGNLIADAQRWAGRGDVAVMNNGGIRADLRAGPSNYGSLFEIQPFANVLSRVTVRGRDLRAYVERFVARGEPRVHVSGILATYDPRRPANQRLVSLTLADGAPIVDDRTYTIVMSDFLVTGGDGLALAERATAVTPLNIVDLDALIGYLKQLPGPVRPPAEQRLKPVTP